MVNKQSLYFIHEQATFLMALLALPVCCVRYKQLQLFVIFFAASLHIIIAKVFSIVFQPASDVMKVFFFFFWKCVKFFSQGNSLITKLSL